LKYSSVYCPRVPRLCHVSEINSIPFCIRAHIFSLAHHHSTWASDGSYLQRRLAGPQFASQILITIAMHYQHLPVLGYLFVENKDTTTVVDIGIRCVCAMLGFAETACTCIPLSHHLRKPERSCFADGNLYAPLPRCGARIPVPVQWGGSIVLDGLRAIHNERR